MRMFDSIYMPCPNCGADIEWQSKAGECLLHAYRIANPMPSAILLDINGQVEQCPSCSWRWTMRSHPQMLFLGNEENQ